MEPLKTLNRLLTQSVIDEWVQKIGKSLRNKPLLPVYGR